MYLNFFESAGEEAEEARTWYRERSLAAEASFLREIDQAVEKIIEAPHRWPRHIAGTQRYVLPTFPYSLIYFVEADIINVVAVVHDSRRPGYWRTRMP